MLRLTCRSMFTARTVRAALLLPAAWVLAATATPVSAVGAQNVVELTQDDAADLYRQGLEAEWNGAYAIARPLYERAGAQGHAQALYQLGFLKMDGLGGPRDVAAARALFRASADAGHALALVPLVYAYDDLDDAGSAPDTILASHALLELSRRDLGMAGDTIQFWSDPLRRQIQRDLQRAGFYRGPIDGLIGQGSLNALRAFARNRGDLPDITAPRFARAVIRADGVSVDEGPLTPFAAMDDLRAVREAFGGVTLTQVDGDRWRLSTGDTHLLDWLRVGDGAGRFELPGKQAGEALRPGMLRTQVGAGDLGACMVVTERQGQAEGEQRRHCETRVAGVQLVFAPEYVPPHDLDSQHGGEGAAVEVYTGLDRLERIEVTPPLTLRLAGN